jgi:metal-dependent amidase/aminoacylase/carboxypeptidase family protein
VDQSDGVWIPRDHGSSINYSDMQNPANRAHAHRSASISSASTNISETTASSRASTTWAELYQQPRSSRRNPSTHAGSVNGSTTRGTNPGFANVRGDWRQQTPRQRAEIAAQREERRQLEAQQNLRDDEDSDDEPFEGEL